MKTHKSRLLATSALAGAGMALSGAAVGDEMKADKMMKPHLTLGGYYFMDAHFADEDGKEDNSSMFMEHDMEVHFNGSGELDNGLKVGARIEFEGAGGARVDDHWIELESGWGKLMLGATDGVGVKTFVKGKSHSYGVSSGLQTDWFSALAGAGCAFRCALGGAALDAGTDDTGIHYFSPRFNGFQFALGYRPEATGSGSENQGAIDETTDQHNAVDVALNYAGEMGGTGIKGSISYGAATAPSMMVPTGTTNKVPNPNGDYSHVAGGLLFSVKGFSIGGHYGRENTDHPQNGTTMGGAIAYEQGPWLIAIDMHSGSIRGVKTNPEESEYNAWSVGGQYTIGPGLRFLAGYQNAELDLEDKAPVDGSAFSLGLAVNF